MSRWAEFRCTGCCLVWARALGRLRLNSSLFFNSVSLHWAERTPPFLMEVEINALETVKVRNRRQQGRVGWGGFCSAHQWLLQTAERRGLLCWTSVTGSHRTWCTSGTEFQKRVSVFHQQSLQLKVKQNCLKSSNGAIQLSWGSRVVVMPSPV